MRSIATSLVLLLFAAALPAWGAAPDRPASTNAPAAAKPSFRPSELFGDKVVAKGKGVEVTRSQLDSEFIRRKAAYAEAQQVAPPELERQALEDLITTQLLINKATDQDRAAAAEQFQKSLEVFKADRKLTDEDFNRRLARQLSIQGLTKEEWNKQQIQGAMARIVLKRELKVNVTDAEARKYYDDYPARFEEPEMVRASHILLTTSDPKTNTELSDEQKAAKRKQMEGILKRARAGEDFAALAKEYSEDPGSKEKGGEYKFPRGQMVPEFEATAFSLNTNQISDIIITRYGYHIIKLSEKIPARKIEFDKAAADIKEFLTQQSMQKQFPDYLAKLKNEAGVEILDEKLKAQELPGAPGPSAAPPAPKPGAK